MLHGKEDSKFDSKNGASVAATSSSSKNHTIVQQEHLRRWWITVGCLTILGASLRIAALPKQSFWYDEAFCDAFVQEASYTDLFFGRVRDNGNPPLHFLLAKFAGGICGTTEVGYRALPALFGTLSIPIIALFVKRLHSSPAGLYAAILIACSPFQIEMSSEARVYSLVHLITALNALFFVLWIAERTTRAGVALAATTAVGCYCHYYMVFFFAAQAIALLGQPEIRKRFPGWLAWQGLALVFWLPWLPAFLTQITTPGNLSRMSQSWETQFAATPVVFAVGRTFAWRDATAPLLGCAAVVALCYWVTAARGLLYDRTDRFTRLFLVAWILTPIFVPLAAALCGVPIYHHRYGSVGLIGFVSAVAIGWTTLSSTWRFAFGAAMLAGTLFSLANFYRYPIKDDWRSAAADYVARHNVDVPILFDSDIEVVPFMYYAKRWNRTPGTAYGLMMSETSDDLLAVRYEAGVKGEPHPENYTREIMGARSVVVASCVPVRHHDFYRRVFERHGFKLKERRDYYRITLLHFEK